MKTMIKLMMASRQPACMSIDHLNTAQFVAMVSYRQLFNTLTSDNGKDAIQIVAPRSRNLFP